MKISDLLIDLAKLLPGLITLIVVVVNILKHFGVVKDGEAFANTAQLIVSIVLTVIGFFFPSLLDLFPYLDRIAEALAELGGFVVPMYIAIVKVANAIHDLLTKFNLFGINKVLAKQLTP